jgi:hypothetical protein
MSLHFSLRPLPSGRVLRLVDGAHACAAAGLALAALQLASAAAHGAAALSLAGLPPVALAWRAARRAVSRSGRLEVDARGAAAWQAAGEPAMPLRPVRWLVFGGRRLDLLSGRDAHPDADWRGLMRWLRWLDRGAAAAGDLESRPGATT